MTRLNRERLDSGVFPVVSEIPTRVGDVDMQRHINNVAIVALFQEGRSLLNREAKLSTVATGMRLRPMVAGITVEYAGETFWPDPVEVHTGVISLGRSSFVLGQVLRQRGRSTAYAEVAMVLADKNGPAALPAELRGLYDTLRIAWPAAS